MGWRGMDHKGAQGNLAMMDMLIILIVMVSLLYTYVKVNQILYFKYIQCQLYTNYTSIKLVLKKNLSFPKARLER